jgi:DNA repair exonuclease SbcCD ATPase subunit
VKLERVALRGFLSHTATDWRANGARLVTFVGANGAGKSTLASDALRYALFDVARAKTDELVQVGATDMSVLVEFEYSGARYRVTRGRTTKSGGKSYLELAIADGAGWRPLTGDTIRDTQAAIAELLRLDADTFETAVLLAQGEANRFAEATATERKRILGQVLGLERYARAEARTRELARDVDARSGESRSQLDRLSTQLAELAQVDEVLGRVRDAVARADDELGAQRSARNAVEVRIRNLDIAIAAANAATSDLEQVRRDRDALAGEYRAARDRKAASEQAIVEAERLTGAAVDVEIAVGRLPVVRAEVERLVALEEQDRRLSAEITTKRSDLAASRKPHDEAVATWERESTAATAKVTALEAMGFGSAAAVCPECGQALGEEHILEQLTRARKTVKALAAVKPREPVRFSQDAAAILRLEERQRELGFDPYALARAHRELTQVTSVAARAEAIAGARATIERERAAIAAVTDDLARIGERGAVLKARLDELEAKRAEADPLRAELATVRGELALVDVAIGDLERGIREGERGIAQAEANVRRRDELAGEREQLEASIERSTSELLLLRRLVTTFGPTGIPARIIESVLPELGAYANELLADLRPGMTLELRAQRVKRDGSGIVEALDLVVRDDVGERGLALFSGGERMSVSLALAVALSRLVARRAGTAIRTLVIDEPDGLDADARRAFGQALRVLAHRGELERVVLVSHHEDLAEVGDALYRVTKNGHGSVVEQIA